MQRERLKTPYPWTWEIPTAVTLAVLLGLVTSIQVGRTLANLVVGAGLTWPAADPGAAVAAPSPIGTALWASLARVLAGDAAAGLPRPVPDDLAPPWLLWTTVGGTEAVVLCLMTWIGVACYTRWGPGRMKGMASASEAEQLLGFSRLRKVAALVRPDLYGKQPARQPVFGAPASRTQSAHTGDESAASPWLMLRRGRGGAR